MARQRRIWYPGATYHITSRGNRRYNIFLDDWDRKKYLSLLMKTREQHPFILHSYCLMTNHIHLLLETIDTPLDQIMKNLNQRYAMYFNNRYDFDGHVFQGRYGAEIIDSISYFLYVSKYIHLNPVNAKLVSHPLNYQWSSYRFFLQNKTSPLVNIEKILSYFTHPSYQSYRQYVEDGARPISL